MKIFVTGGTGFVGREIVRQLHEEGRTIRLLVRNPDSERVQELISRYRVEVRAGNVLDAGSLAGALEGMHAVIHLVGIISEIRENTFENVHTTGTQNILAATREAGIERFVHMSALGVRPAPAKWKSTVFDRVWLLSPKDGRMQLQDLPQRLLHGDSKH